MSLSQVSHAVPIQIQITVKMRAKAKWLISIGNILGKATYKICDLDVGLTL